MIKAIIFDKDGTLIDFDSFWVSVSENVIKNILKDFKREDIPKEEFLEKIGVKNGVTDIDAVLCKGTYEQIADAINEVLEKNDCYKVQAKRVIDEYNRCADFGEIRPTCEKLREVLVSLKEYGIKLAVVTTDNYEITCKCLEKLGIEDLFDKVYTDDGKTPVKPDPFCVSDFCSLTGIKTCEIMMVGDTMTDVRFARNAGISVVVVGSNPANRQRLADYADTVIPDVSYLPEFIKGDKE